MSDSSPKAHRQEPYVTGILSSLDVPIKYVATITSVDPGRGRDRAGPGPPAVLFCGHLHRSEKAATFCALQIRRRFGLEVAGRVG